MQYDAAWYARISLVLSGALRIWGVRGTVTRDPSDAGAFVLSVAGAPEMRIAHRAEGWFVSLHGDQAPLASHAGLHGLLRRLRAELAPDAPAGRLVIAR